jgi:L-threonylcarbamoyladenylate synthase
MASIENGEIERCRKAVIAGKVLAYPTETVWGLGADLNAPEAVKAIFEMKGRADTKAVSLLVRDISMAREFAETDSAIESLMQIFWPGPMTFVLQSKISVPESIHGGTGFVGLRCSSHLFVRELVRRLPRPITTTSANRAGEPPAQSADELSWVSRKTVVAKWSVSEKGTSLKGSTIARMTGKHFEILRDGDLPVELFRTMANRFGLIETKSS